jgi:DNA repair exonuclease SbcCD nuclease subunit
MKLLCLGDIHLGRQPSRLSSELLEYVSRRELSPAEAWRRAVAEALRQEVDAVLLAGDVVEQNDDFYEAYGDLRQGVERLAGADVQVIAVAGNHDVKVLPRLANELPALRLLGRNGRWESVTVDASDGSRAQIIGWSFPDVAVQSSPLVAGLPEREAPTTIGLLHCDRDRPASRYAPVRSAELADAAVDAWLLGHIHKPDALSAPRPIGYLGSLTGMDPGESGPHGAWLLQINSGGAIGIEHSPLAPLRWEEIEVPVDALADADNLHGLIVEALNRLHRRIDAGAQKPRALGCRLRFTGRTAHRRGIERVLAADDPRLTPQEIGDIVYFVHDWRLEALPALDLAELARAGDPVGLLARKLCCLRGGDSPERRILIQNARQQLAGAIASRHYAALNAEPPDEQQTAAVLEAAALGALDELLAQRGSAA